MKYQNTLTVEVPLSRFVELMHNPENMPHWQRGLVSFEPLSEDSEAVGAQMRLTYQMGKRRLVMTETIVRNDKPHHFDATYETKGVWNRVNNRFDEDGNGHTVWRSECEFRFSGLMKVMSWFMPKSVFSKQSCQYMQDFKRFAETGESVGNAATKGA